MKLIVGTRGSALARWQTDFAIAALLQRAPDLQTETRIVKTSGDADQVRALADFGGLGVFTKEIENALLAREIDLAVHSLKDLPTETTSGLTLAAITRREDPRDCLVSRHHLRLADLPPGARIGTSSARRAAQVLALRPDTQVAPLRGNVDTRLRKAATAEYDAIVLAAAGLIRLGRASEITEYLPLDSFLPDPGQGALAIQIREGEPDLAALVASLDHAPTRAAVTAERAFLRELGGGCRMPIGCYAELRGDEVVLRGLIASDDGRRVARGEISGPPDQADELGEQLARQLGGASQTPASGALRNPGRGSDQSGPESAPRGPSSLQATLQGKRILITRAKEQATPLAARLAALGAEPVEFPVIEFAPLEDFRDLDMILERAGEFDWIVFTSANGVRAVNDRLQSLGHSPRISASTKLAAIGPATARALNEMGLHVDFVPTKYLGKYVGSELPIHPGQRVLLLRANLASDDLARSLEARGAVVTDVDAYRTVAPPSQGVDLSVDAVTFTSSSTVKNLAARLGDGERRRLDGAAVFCIGPVTAETARQLGWRVDAVAAEQTIDGLVDSIVQHYTTTAR